MDIDKYLSEDKVFIFSKSYCPYCRKVKKLFDELNVKYGSLELDLLGEEGPKIQMMLREKTGMGTVPNVFVGRHHVGGCDDTFKAYAAGELKKLLEQVSGVSTGPSSQDPSEQTAAQYDYDLIVIGGGSGGLAASKEAGALGKKVAVCDFVVPSPPGTTWGLGGTCVNVGCIPKKLMHKAAIIGEDMNDAPHFGWNMSEITTHDWDKMVSEIQSYIKSLNFGYRKALRDKSVTYLNAYAKFVDEHTIETRDKKNKVKNVTAENFIIAVGCRPTYPEIPGALEFGITSDDLFSLDYNPGKTLIVGASYVALECAGFLNGIGVDCTVMVRSILLRGFDQQMAEMIGQHMTDHGVKFLRPCVPTEVECLEEGKPGCLRVTAKMNDVTIVDEYNTVIFAIGRTACTKGIGLETVGVSVNESNSKIMVKEDEQTSVNNIFAIGDVIEGKLELTPVAIQAGKLLAHRLFGRKTHLTDYTNVPTTIFTPLEYGCVGLSEEQAQKQYGEADVEVYHTFYQPLEYALSGRDKNKCYAKLICILSLQEKVVGLHVLGPNAGEITQGYALAIKLGAKKLDFADLIGIHPTNAEVFTTMDVTKSSGANVDRTDC